MQTRRLAVVLSSAFVAALAIWLWSRGPGAPDPGALDPGAQPSAEALESGPPGPPPPRAVEDPQADEIVIASGQTIEIDSKSLDAQTPVVVRLDLGVASATDEPRPVRLIGPGGFVRHGEGAVGEGRASARYEIDPTWLAPGRYIIEVKTTEPSHFPLRRYALEVR